MHIKIGKVLFLTALFAISTPTLAQQEQEARISAPPSSPEGQLQPKARYDQKNKRNQDLEKKMSDMLREIFSYNYEEFPHVMALLGGAQKTLNSLWKDASEHQVQAASKSYWDSAGLWADEAYKHQLSAVDLVYRAKEYLETHNARKK